MKRSIISVLAAFISSVIFIQANSLPVAETDEYILTKLNDYCTRFPREEIYVQTDRDNYISGEDMWLNVTAVDRKSGMLSSLSRIAYCELIDPDNNPVIRKRFLLLSGKGPGYLLLPDTIRSGEYTLAVYTNWMKNFFPENCFMKRITIYNPFRNSPFKTKYSGVSISDRKVSIKFYPEGGSLINEVPSRVGVRINDHLGKGIESACIIRNNAGDSVTFFRTDESGSGLFEFIPVEGIRYAVSCRGTDEFLPDASDSGCSLKAESPGTEKVLVTVMCKEKKMNSTERRFLLFIHSHGIRTYSEFFRMTGEKADISVSRASLLPGINHITLFSEEGVPLCERYIFNRKEKPPVRILTDKDIFSRRTITEQEFGLSGLGIRNYSGTSLGLSVVPVNSVTDSQDIEDYFVFGTEFGFLPDGLLKKKICDIDDAVMDNFLLTVESNWLSWDKILSGNKASVEFLPEKDGHYISGFLKKRDSDEFIRNETVYLSIPGKTATFQYSITDSSGLFRFLLPAVHSPHDLIIQPADPEADMIIQMDNSYVPLQPSTISYTDSVSSSGQKSLSFLSVGYQIDKIYNIIRHEDPDNQINVYKPSGRFYGFPEQEIVMDDYIRLPVMQEIFFELIPGVKLRSKKPGYELRVSNPVDNTIYDDPPLALIDGVVINDLSVLADLNTESIGRIETIRTPYLTGGLVHYGIINVITLSGNFENIPLPDYAARLTYRTADPVPVFKAQAYTDSKSASRIPDFGNTIYWNPSIRCDENGIVHTGFRTSDRPGDYLITVQGISDDGKLISVKKIITVE
ncbi:MAG TPA: hypothetical protein PLB27_11655 [Bacteroidales bacterium]|nr:hypothetical protein [Bacteroidales bacterium]